MTANAGRRGNPKGTLVPSVHNFIENGTIDLQQ